MRMKVIVCGAVASAALAVGVGFVTFAPGSSDAQSPLASATSKTMQLTEVGARAIALKAADDEFARISGTLGRPIATVGDKGVAIGDLTESGHAVAQPGVVSHSAVVSTGAIVYTGRPDQGALWSFTFERPDVHLTDPDAKAGPHKLVVTIVVADASETAVDVNVAAY